MAQKTGSWIHSGSFIEREGDLLFNVSWLISPGGEIAGTYRKIHLFEFNSEEAKILTPGDRGAEIFIVCSAWSYPKFEAWQIFNRVRAKMVLPGVPCSTAKKSPFQYLSHKLPVCTKN